MSDTRLMLEIVRLEQKEIRDRLRDLDEREKVILGWIEADDKPNQPTASLPIYPAFPVRT